MIQNAIGRKSQLKKEDFRIHTKRKTYKISGKRVHKEYFRAYLIAKLPCKSKHIYYNVNDKKSIVHTSFNVTQFQNKNHFTKRQAAKEYLMLNFLIDKHSPILIELYQNIYEKDIEDNGNNKSSEHLQTITIPQRQDKSKHGRLAHYVMSCTNNKIYISACDFEGKCSNSNNSWRAIEISNGRKKPKL
jgi:hypothetical protein